MLPGDDIDIAQKIFRKDGIVERGEDNDEGTAAQTQADEAANLVEIGIHGARLEGIDGIAAGLIVCGAGAGPDEIFDTVGKGEEAEEVALLFGGEADEEGGGNVAFDGILAGAEAGGVEGDVDLLGAFDLENLGDRAAAAGGGLPMNVLGAVAGDVVAQFFKFPALADLALDMTAEGAAEHQAQAEAVFLEIRIDADLGGNGQAAAYVPKSERRGSLCVGGVEEKRPRRVGRQGQVNFDHSASAGRATLSSSQGVVNSTGRGRARRSVRA